VIRRIDDLHDLAGNSETHGWFLSSWSADPWQRIADEHVDDAAASERRA
jgi:hypothetical protein